MSPRMAAQATERSQFANQLLAAGTDAGREKDGWLVQIVHLVGPTAAVAPHGEQQPNNWRGGVINGCSVGRGPGEEIREPGRRWRGRGETGHCGYIEADIAMEAVLVHV